MNAERLAVAFLTLMGLMISIAGILLTIHFNFNYIKGLNIFVRYVGLCVGLILMFIGFHVLIVGIVSLRS